MIDRSQDYLAVAGAAGATFTGATLTARFFSTILCLVVLTAATFLVGAAKVVGVVTGTAKAAVATQMIPVNNIAIFFIVFTSLLLD
jgi:hypothetical protein